MKRPRPTPYRETDPIPNDPKLIVTAKAETPAEIAKRRRIGGRFGVFHSRIVAW